ncbi:MAG: acetyl-CoA carboxylase biotin carboxyl carrier protein [Clostridia bacterium]|nr:acetyl-CoA carboxylase biotin carboxyl carrier protein [Clostridia bacterium]
MSIKINEIKELIELVEKTGLTELRLETSGTKVVIKKEAPVVAAPVAAPVQVQAAETQQPPVVAEAITAQEEKKLPENQVTINSPMVGTFYRAPSPEAEAFVQEGQIVEPGQELCIIEAMKLMNTIESDFRGRVLKIMVENAQPVEYGQPLFLMEKL